MNFRKLTIEPHRQMRRCHNPHWHGPLIPMDAPEPHWITKAIIIAAGIYGVAIWFGA